MALHLNIITKLFQETEYKKIISLVKDELLYKESLNNRKDNIKELEPKICYYYALSLVKIKEYAQAIQVLNAVIEANMGIALNYQCKMIRGYVFTHCNQFRNAEKEFLKLIEDGYESVLIYSALGHIAFKLARQDDAVFYLEKALKIEPENISALNSMSFVLAEYDLDLNKAAEHIEKVLKIEPRNPIYLDTYGYILFKQAKYHEAIKVFEYAYNAYQHPLIKRHLEEARNKISLPIDN